MKRARAAAPHLARIGPEHTDSKAYRLDLLSRDAIPLIRERAAVDYHITREIAARLLEDDNEGVRCCLARNTEVHPDILERLALDPSENVRGFLALNPSLPLRTRRELHQDESETVRRLLTWYDTVE